MSETAIGIGLGLGIPWCLLMSYICYRWTCKNEKCTRAYLCSYCESTQDPFQNFIQQSLSKEAYEDFSKGLLSLKLQQELIVLRNKRTVDMRIFKDEAKAKKYTQIMIFLLDPDFQGKSPV